MFSAPEAQNTGTTAPVRTAVRSPATSSSSLSVPSSKNRDIRSSSASATSSTNASLAFFASAAMVSGMATGLPRPVPPS